MKDEASSSAAASLSSDGTSSVLGATGLAAASPTTPTAQRSLPAAGGGAKAARSLARTTVLMRGKETTTLILLRHGQSAWNACPRFTGWCDIPLTERGEAEAVAAGRLLAERGVKVDAAFCSALDRAKRTLDLCVEACGCASELQSDWRLNERHYGALQGLRKDDPELLEAPLPHSAMTSPPTSEQMSLWRRSFDVAPPAMTEDHPYFVPGPGPRTESLADCQKRVLAFYREAIAPELLPGRTVLLAAHANTLRALLCALDDVPDEQVPQVHVPNGVPCVFLLDPTTLKPHPAVGRCDSASGGSYARWLLSAENYARLKKEIGGSGSLARSIFETWDSNKDGVLDRSEIENGLRALVGGDDFTVAVAAGSLLSELATADETISLETFQAHANEACQKFAPALLGSAHDATTA